MSLDYAILGFLSEGERTGYDLKTRCFDSEAHHFWTVDQAQVYRTLDRLERDALVASDFQVQHGRPNRRVFSITDSGRKALRDWVSSPHDPPPPRDPLLAQLRFGSTVSDATLAEVLTAHRATQQRHLERMRERLAHHRTDQPAGKRHALMLMTLEASIAHARSTVDWLDDCLEELGSAEEAAR